MEIKETRGRKRKYEWSNFEAGEFRKGLSFSAVMSFRKYVKDNGLNWEYRSWTEEDGTVTLVDNMTAKDKKLLKRFNIDTKDMICSTNISKVYKDLEADKIELYEHEGAKWLIVTRTGNNFNHQYHIPVN